MKRMNYKRKLISCVVIWSVFISSLLLYSPETHVFSASGIPEITLTSHVGDTMFNVSTVEFTGQIFDDNTTPDHLTLKVLEKLNDSEKPIEITSEGKLTISNMGEYAQFSFSKEFSEGDHTIIFAASDETENTSEFTRSFSVALEQMEKTESTPAPEPTQTGSSPNLAKSLSAQDTGAGDGSKPYVGEIKLIPPTGNDEESYLNAEDMTQVPIDYRMRILIRTSGELTATQPKITVLPDIGDISGVMEGDPVIGKDGLKEYVFIFTPDQLLQTSTTYYVYLDPNISNDANNKIVPRFFKFTTISTNEQYQFPADGRPKDFIHGNYSNVTNSCAYCHSTHTGKTPALEGGKYGKSADNLCMACHDGTNGISMPDKNAASKHKHAEGKFADSDSCTGCHNPHTGWTKENPNRLQSKSITDATGTHFQTYSYKKGSSVTGSSEDFSLCLSCHNGQKGVSNIDQYYKSESYVSQSGHKITPSNAGGENGQLPCAECHETHGSNNIMMLKEELGNVRITDDKDKYKTSFDTWTAYDERAFCMKCHDGSKVIYGKTGTFSATKADSVTPITGHQTGDDQACSNCHGGASGTAIEAAHAPSPGTTP